MKRFIEESFPVKEVSMESAREKNIRHGHISTLHIWWARRPLASSRATNYAALIPAPANIDEWNQKRQFIIDFSRWENSLDQGMIARAREDILKANGGKPPKVLDPFGGGGAIPLEALRLGCETYSNDYNPVAVLIQKCTLEYPQKYGRRGIGEGRRGIGDRRWEIGGKDEDRKLSRSARNAPISYSLFGEKNVDPLSPISNPLLADVKKWSKWVLKEAKEEIGRFYPAEEDGSIPVGYIWARTIPCQNPACGAEIPLMRQYWLAKKSSKQVALYPYIERVGQASCLLFKIVGDGYEPMPEGFDPTHGTVSRAVATCPVCGSVVDANTTRRLFQEGRSGQRMVAVVLHKPGQSGKRYRIATEKDLEVFTATAEYLKEKREKLLLEWGMDPVPDEPTPEGKGRGAERAFSVRNYGMNTWGDLFNARQKLALITFAEKVRKAHGEMLAEDKDYIRAVQSYLAIILSKFSSTSNLLCRWNNAAEAIAGKPDQTAKMEMKWDYPESNPFSGSTGSYQNNMNSVLNVFNKRILEVPSKSNIFQETSTSFQLPNDFFDAVFTDPPYYDNFPYSHLSDFFYVWLKRVLGDLYPDLFSTPLTPKKNEIVAYSNRPGGFDEGKRFFENMLKKSFQEIHRVLKSNGIATIVYAHKSTEGWETLINSLLDSSLVVTASWPIETERKGRQRAQESAALASSIYIVARKMERQPTGFYNEVKEELNRHLNQKLDRLWEEGIGGADFFISAIGSAIEVFGKYEKVMDYEGTIVRADRLLEEVRKIATDYAVRQILHNGFAGEISDLTRFYVLYRWNYGAVKVHFDEARKLAQSCSIDLTREWSGQGFITKEKEFIRVRGPQERRPEDLERSSELIDVLHRVLLLWEKSQREEMVRMLKESGYGDSEAFYRVAQAISETLPMDNKEKKLLDGFLAGRERLREDIRTSARAIQGRLFE